MSNRHARRASALTAIVLATLTVGCAGPAPSASSSATAAPTTAATARPTATPRPTSTPRPTATPLPTLSVDGASAIERFMDFAEATDIPYHMDIDLEVGVLGQSVRMAMAFDAQGPDMAGTMRIAAGAERIVTDVVVVDGRTFVRSADATWIEVPEASPVENPWDSLRLDLLTIEGQEVIDGVPHHHLQIDDPSVALTADVDQTVFSEVVIDRGLFDVYVTDDGLPTRSRVTILGSAVVNGIRTQLEIVGVYSFSAIGTPVDIEPPF